MEFHLGAFSGKVASCHITASPIVCPSVSILLSCQVTSTFKLSDGAGRSLMDYAQLLNPKGWLHLLLSNAGGRILSQLFNPKGPPLPMLMLMAWHSLLPYFHCFLDSTLASMLFCSDRHSFVPRMIWFRMMADLRFVKSGGVSGHLHEGSPDTVRQLRGVANMADLTGGPYRPTADKGHLMGNTSDSSNEGGSANETRQDDVPSLKRWCACPWAFVRGSFGTWIYLHASETKKNCQELSSSAQLCSPTTKKKK